MYKGCKNQQKQRIEAEWNVIPHLEMILDMSYQLRVEHTLAQKYT